MQGIILKPGKEKPIRNRHHWIFSGAIQHYPEKFENGQIYPVFSTQKELLGSAYFNQKCSIAGRMLSFGKANALESIKKNVLEAIALRKSFFKAGVTNAYRLINGEGDGLPGLIIDQYDNVLVFQINTLGMEKLKPFLIDICLKALQPDLIYEKSLSPSRHEEGLEPFQGALSGTSLDQVSILENGLKFLVPLADGQKTGFFIDHRSMREWVKDLSPGKKILNCFAYTGAFTVYALAGGAAQAVSVDISEQAQKLGEQNLALNGFNAEDHPFNRADVFQFLREQTLDYDLIILDPPAFAKRQKDVVAACRGYKDINRIALQKMPPRSLLLTCSCSYHVDEPLFQKVLFQAALEANRSVKILGKHRLATDHPINIFHPEGDYLKSFLLYVE